MAPRVSVVIAAYNAERYLAATLRSVLAQTFEDFEIVVVDDASSDGTVAVAESTGDARVRVIHCEQNGGPAAARNRGIAEACGEYVATLDSDDLSYPDRLLEQVAFLDTHPATVLVACEFEFVSPEGHISPAPTRVPHTNAELRFALLLGNPVTLSSELFRRQAALDTGGFPDGHTAEDYEFLLRIADLGEIALIGRVLGAYRRHDGGLSSTRASELRENALRITAENAARFLGRSLDPETVRVAKNEAAADTAAQTLVAGYELALEVWERYLADVPMTAAERRFVFESGLQRLRRVGRRAGLRGRPVRDALRVALAHDRSRLLSPGFARFAARQLLR